MSGYFPRTGLNPGSPDRDRDIPPAVSSPASPKADQSGPELAARLTGLSRDLLYDEMRRGNLTYVKVGRRWLITRHHLQQFLGDAPT